MTLARFMVITDRSLMRPAFSEALSSAVLGGARLLQLREKNLSQSGVLRLAQTSQAICEQSRARLLINSDYEITRKIGAFGTHLRESQSVHEARKVLEPKYSVGQSVHSLDAAFHAARAGADYLVFGSIFPTESHPESTPLGLDALREFTRQVSIPVFAVGGICIHNARDCLDAGAYGVAVVRAVWDAPNTEIAVREFNRVLNCQT